MLKIFKSGKEKFLEKELLPFLRAQYVKYEDYLYEEFTHIFNFRKDSSMTGKALSEYTEKNAKAAICQYRNECVFEDGSISQDFFIDLNHKARKNPKIYGTLSAALDGDDSGDDFGIDTSNIEETGPDALSVAVIAVNAVELPAYTFRPDREPQTDFLRRMKEETAKLSYCEAASILKVFYRLIREGEIKELPPYVQKMESIPCPRGMSAASGAAGKAASGSHAFVFICRGPDPTGFTNILHGMHITGDGLPEAMARQGFTGLKNNVHMYGPDWNSTIYSSSKCSMAGEADDLVSKIKEQMRRDGFQYGGENIRTLEYAPETSYAQMGLFLAYLFTE